MKFHKYVAFLVILPLIASQTSQTFWSNYPTCEEQCHQSVWESQQCSLDNDICDCGTSANCLCLQDDCLCRAPKWLTAVAKCIGENCGASGVGDAASIVNSACTANGIPLAVNSEMLILIGLNAAATASEPHSAAATTAATTQQQVTDTPTSVSSSSSSNAQISPTLNPVTSSASSELPVTTPPTTSSSGGPKPTVTPSSSSSNNNGLTSSDKIALGVGLGVGIPPCIVAIWKLWTLCALKGKSVK